MTWLPTKKSTVTLTGDNLSTEVAVQLGNQGTRIALSREAMINVRRSRAIVDDILTSDAVVYGINTGFGPNATKTIPPSELDELQRRIIKSHAGGVVSGIINETPILSLEEARTVTALRISVLLRGHSGVRPEIIERFVDIYNKGIAPWVPRLGSVGASGDLAPLAHVALGFTMGEGMLWDPTEQKWGNAKNVLERHGIEPVYDLKAKEGLALINGTQFTCGVGSYSIEEVEAAYYASISAAALSAVAYKAHRAAFSPAAADAKPHSEQGEVAAALYKLTEGIVERTDRPQSPYSYRTIPTVAGTSLHLIRDAKRIVSQEMNSSTDNPLTIPDEGVVMAGDFHGQWPSVALDMTSMAAKTLADIGSQRTKRIYEAKNLPSLLGADAGLDSGFMIQEIAITAMTATPVIAHSTTSQESGLGTEDHTSMGPHAAKQAAEKSAALLYVTAVELASAVQAIRIRQRKDPEIVVPELLKPVFNLISERFPDLTEDRSMALDISRVSRTILLEADLFKKTYDTALRGTEYERSADISRARA